LGLIVEGSPTRGDNNQEAGRVKKLTALSFILFFLCISLPQLSRAQTGLHKVNHNIVVMQENHSFDNYFGALAYAPGTPYHGTPGTGGCSPDDHACADGLSCMLDASGTLHCFNSNLDENGSQVFAFHEPSRCVIPNLNHSWAPTHQEANYLNPRNTLGNSLGDGFVRVNDSTEQIDNGVETATEDQTIGFCNQTDIPFYHDLAQKFAISDRHFSSLLGPTFPNRSYLMAATSLGHLTTDDTFPPQGAPVISRSLERSSTCLIRTTQRGRTTFRMLRRAPAFDCSLPEVPAQQE
jgi:phospholipase C